MHGGTTAVGIASKAFKHGKRSKYAPHLPALALGAYSEALDSRELLALREEIALVDAQIISALEAMKVVPRRRAVEDDGLPRRDRLTSRPAAETRRVGAEKLPRGGGDSHCRASKTILSGRKQRQVRVVTVAPVSLPARDLSKQACRLELRHQFVRRPIRTVQPVFDQPYAQEGLFKEVIQKGSTGSTPDSLADLFAVLFS
jgi:hypothetical protein